MTSALSRVALEDHLADHGFASWGVAEAGVIAEPHDMLTDWLASGRHGSLSYMSRRAGLLRDPSGASYLEGARSIVMVSMAVTRDEPRPATVAAAIARHARGFDYHDVLSARLRLVLAALKREHPGLHGRLFVDTAPVMEKPWAQRAGLGWIGRNGLLIQRDIGSFAMLGGLALTAEVQIDTPAEDGCGECTSCIEACPVGAIGPDRLVDARLCLSALTVERDDLLTRAQADALSGRSAFGCDLCQLACPHNTEAVRGPDEFTPRALLDSITPEQYLALDPGSASWVIRGTAMESLGAPLFSDSLRASIVP